MPILRKVIRNYADDIAEESLQRLANEKAEMMAKRNTKMMNDDLFMSGKASDVPEVDMYDPKDLGLRMEDIPETDLDITRKKLRETLTKKDPKDINVGIQRASEMSNPEASQLDNLLRSFKWGMQDPHAARQSFAIKANGEPVGLVSMRDGHVRGLELASDVRGKGIVDRAYDQIAEQMPDKVLRSDENFTDAGRARWEKSLERNPITTRRAISPETGGDMEYFLRQPNSDPRWAARHNELVSELDELATKFEVDINDPTQIEHAPKKFQRLHKSLMNKINFNADTKGIKLKTIAPVAVGGAGLAASQSSDGGIIMGLFKKLLKNLVEESAESGAEKSAKKFTTEAALDAQKAIDDVAHKSLNDGYLDDLAKYNEKVPQVSPTDKQWMEYTDFLNDDAGSYGTLTPEAKQLEEAKFKRLQELINKK